MKILIEDTDNNITMKPEKPIDITEVLRITFSLQLQCMREFIKLVEPKISDKELQELKEHLYDSYNAGASNVLYLFAPDKELHPDLTVEAMKEAEDNYMYRRLNRETRRGLDKNQKKGKANETNNA